MLVIPFVSNRITSIALLFLLNCLHVWECLNVLFFCSAFYVGKIYHLDFASAMPPGACLVWKIEYYHKLTYNRQSVDKYFGQKLINI